MTANMINNPVNMPSLTLPYLTFRVGGLCEPPSTEGIFVTWPNVQPRCNSWPWQTCGGFLTELCSGHLVEDNMLP